MPYGVGVQVPPRAPTLGPQRLLIEEVAGFLLYTAQQSTLALYPKLTIHCKSCLKPSLSIAAFNRDVVF